MGWVALAYGIVLITLATYVLSLHRRLRDANRARETSTPRTASVR